MARRAFTTRVIELIRAIPSGRVATYGGIAGMAGETRAARQVARNLHSSSDRERLPWHRVINKEGYISLPPGKGYELQEQLLLSEAVTPDPAGRIDLARFLWRPEVALVVAILRGIDGD